MPKAPNITVLLASLLFLALCQGCAAPVAEQTALVTPQKKYKDYRTRVAERSAEKLALRRQALQQERTASRMKKVVGFTARPYQRRHQVAQQLAALREDLRRFQLYLDQRSTHSPQARQEKSKVQDKLFFLEKELREVAGFHPGDTIAVKRAKLQRLERRFVQLRMEAHQRIPRF